MSYKNVEILRDKKGYPIPQYFDVLTNQFKPLTRDNYPDIQQVNITNPTIPPNDYPDLESKNILDDINDSVVSILNNLLNYIDTVSYETYIGYSTDVKPSGSEKDIFLELDTEIIYINDGSGWVVFA